MSEDDLLRVEKKIGEWSSDGKRVILMARKVLSGDECCADPTSPECETQMLREAKTGLTFVCTVGLIDSPRSEIPEVVRILRQAQIRVFMVRGSMLTAYSS